MKKILTLIALTTLLGCSQDPLDEMMFEQEVPESLVIGAPIGLKLQSAIVYDEVAINAKFDIAGKYKIKIINFSGKVVSQETIDAQQGDNLLNIYTTALETSSYKVYITDMNDVVLGVEVFSMAN